MDERVKEDEDPDRYRHEADARPHAQHGTSVVIGLQSRAELALCEDDESVKDLVELAQVEEPAVEGQTLVPQTAGSEAAGTAIRAKDGRGVSSIRLPGLGLWVEEGGVAEAGRTVDAADRVDEASNARGAERAHDGATKSVKHAPPGPGRVDGQEDIVENDENAEEEGLADSPRLLAVRFVVGVQKLSGNGVDGRDGDGHAEVQSSVVDVIGNVERRGRRRAACWRRRNKAGSVGTLRRDAQQRGRGEGQEDGERSHLCRLDADDKPDRPHEDAFEEEGENGEKERRGGGEDLKQ